MSKVEAYKCDHCNTVVEESGIVGVDRVEDMFDKEKSFPTIPNPAKAFLHYCVDCYRTHVLIPAANLSDRKRDEREYELKVKELAYGLRRTTVFKYNERQRLRQGKKKS